MTREYEGTAVIDEDGDLELHLRTGLPAGPRKFRLLVIDEVTGPRAQTEQVPWEPPTIHVGEVLPAFSMSREDLYDQNGRL